MIRTGLIGRAIKASRSPWLHEQEGKAQGLDLTYELFDFTERGLDDAELGPLLRRLAGEGFSGVNVTFPFKQAVMPLLDELGACAASVGAVNTVAMRAGRLIGYNTDMAGFRDSLEAGLPGCALNRVLLLGAGGAGSAVAHALLSLGVGQLEVSDRDETKVASLTEQVTQRYGADRVLARRSADLDTSKVDGVVNATPMGMASAPGLPIPEGLIEPHHWVADIVYFPLETELLRVARTKGCRTLNGSGMVIAQAAAAFEIFTGSKADTVRMRASFGG